ncbi:MAG: hypothetical protein M3O36_01305 [Myxococcota bacterium]|nr:hypothetical protein [Myxococcota bacterium]
MSLRRLGRKAAGGAALSVLFSLSMTASGAQRRPPKPTLSGTTPTVATGAGAATIEVTVVQVAAAQAFLQPGAAAGVRRNARVVINRREFAVVQASDSFAVIDVGADPPHEQDKGVASIVGVEEEKAKELAKPQPLSTWKGAWTKAEPPANSQTPRFVPLGSGERDRRWDVRLSLSVGGTFPLGSRGSSLEVAELDALVHAEPFESTTALDLDVSLQRWAAADLGTRAGDAARPVIWLRELLLSHTASSWYGGLGRMRYAASTLGALDGARVRAPLGEGFSLAAFGGLLPNPLSGEPSLAAQRFGVEATYSRPEIGLRPEAALVVHGSTFQGALDERRVSGTFGVYPGPSRLGGYFELTGFDGKNPWSAAPLALTAAGVDASTRLGPVQLGGRVDVRQPERSRWLASFLPTPWFCKTVPSASGGDACDGSVSTRAVATLDASVTMANVSVTVGGSTTRDLTQSGAPDTLGGFAAGRVVRIAKVARADASASVSQGTYLNIVQASAGPGVTLLGDALDVSAYFRTATLSYRSANASLRQQALGLTLGVFPSSDLLFTLQGEATMGDDTKALLLFGTAMWRPRFPSHRDGGR